MFACVCDVIFLSAWSTIRDQSHCILRRSGSSVTKKRGGKRKSSAGTKNSPRAAVRSRAFVEEDLDSLERATPLNRGRLMAGALMDRQVGGILSGSIVA